jgi:hypothetical protein
MPQTGRGRRDRKFITLVPQHEQDGIVELAALGGDELVPVSGDECVQVASPELTTFGRTLLLYPANRRISFPFAELQMHAVEVSSTD